MPALNRLPLVDAQGWLDGVRRVPSPNFDARPAAASVDLLVIHNISLPPGELEGAPVAALFTNTLEPRAHPFFAALTGLRVSSHFVLERDGRITQFVSCDARAWHAGASVHRGRPRCNDFSIGIELVGTDFAPFADAQYDALARLTAALRARYALAAVCGHSDIARGRKTDPGPYFDWQRCAAATGLPRD